MADKPIFYMQRFGTSNDAGQPIKNLEVDFPSLRVARVIGLEDKGKPKNIYTEDYAESDNLRVHIPPTICRKATEIVLSLVFVGDNHRRAYQDFYDYVKSNKVYYWDNVRNLKVALFLNSEVKPSQDIVKGNPQYIVVDFKFQNISGEAVRV